MSVWDVSGEVILHENESRNGQLQPIIIALLSSLCMHAVLIWASPKIQAPRLNAANMGGVIYILPDQNGIKNTDSKTPLTSFLQHNLAKRIENNDRLPKNTNSIPKLDLQSKWELKLEVKLKTEPKPVDKSTSVNNENIEKTNKQTAETVSDPAPPKILTDQIDRSEMTKLKEVQPGAGVKITASYTPKPHYPLLARQMGYSGTVWIMIDIDKQGIPTSVSIKKSSGYEILDRSAMKIIWKWRFNVSLSSRSNIARLVDVPIKFTLE